MKIRILPAHVPPVYYYLQLAQGCGSGKVIGNGGFVEQTHNPYSSKSRWSVEEPDIVVYFKHCTRKLVYEVTSMWGRKVAIMTNLEKKKVYSRF